MRISILYMFLISSISIVYGQFSPGKLMKAHSTLEGSKNCTKCHDLGNKVTNAKCLDCHKELRTLIYKNRGYHAYKTVKEAACVKCHSDHHGSNFEAVRFDEKSFDHNQTGYKLEGGHSRVDCRKCHKSENISISKYKKNSKTFLGLEEKCTTCHTDYHQGTLSINCLNCHTMESFKEAPKFDHNKSKFPLTGAHVEVDCIKCHSKSTRNSKEYQQFKGVGFSNCTSCHKDQHDGAFGNDCKKCHNTSSWTTVKFSGDFNHNQTGFPLEGLHTNVTCNQCHKGGNFSQKINHGKCVDCHLDYHKGEVKKTNESFTDCSRCHSIEKKFTYSSYGLEDHENSDFKLRGAHVAQPCFACHKKNNDTRWSFDIKSNNCTDCHENIHNESISEKYMPNKNCTECHSVNIWSEIKFDHTKTNFVLDGKHSEVSCKKCHFSNDEKTNKATQQFKRLNTECFACHESVHGKQFEENGVTLCKKCHSVSVNSWKINNFNHNKTQFPLEGGHEGVSCSKCHKSEDDGNGKQIVLYKLKSFKCIDCHY